MSGYQRLSVVPIMRGTKRPEVHLAQEALSLIGFYDGEIDGRAGKKMLRAIFEFQEENGCLADGVLGKDTWTLVLKRAYLKGLKPDLKRRIQSLITYYEVGHRTNAYGFAEPDIGDGAGSNFGICQHNALGSMNLLLKMAGRNDLRKAYHTHNKTHKASVLPALRDWFNSSEGIAAQDTYFTKTIWRLASGIMNELKVFNEYKDDPLLNPYYERAMLLCCDSVVQNGGLWSPNRRPFWNTITNAERKVAVYRELYDGDQWDERLMFHLPYGMLKRRFLEVEKELGTGKKGRQATNKKVMLEFLEIEKDPEKRLFMIAQWRARSSWSKYFKDVLDRRMLDAMGVGSVHGRSFNLLDDYGLGVKGDEANEDESPENFHETFIKNADELFPELKESEDG